MEKEFNAKKFDEVILIGNGNESEELIAAKEYLKDIQMTINIGDMSDTLFSFENISNITSKDEEAFFSNLKESIFSTHSLNFLEKVKLLTSFQGLSVKQVKNSDFGSNDNFVYLNQNLTKHLQEFITATWDCILLIKMSHAKDETSILIEKFNDFFANLTKIKTGNPNAYVKKEDALDMITELVLFLQYYVSDFLIFLLKSQADISNEKAVEQTNKKFTKILQKSSKIAHRLQMLQQIKSNNYQLLLKLLLDQKNSEIRPKPFVPLA